ncbi:MAG: hypothetical protein HRT74_06500 [Flavobacteriales bacterium]|nr:hypothetical protein [Flavobacteriales bacterium]
MDDKKSQHTFSGKFNQGKIEGEVYIRGFEPSLGGYNIEGSIFNAKMNGKWKVNETIRRRHKVQEHTVAVYHFKNGLLEGEYKQFYPIRFGKGLFKQATYHNDLVDGALETYYEDGKLRSVQSYIPQMDTRSEDFKRNSKLDFPKATFAQVRHGAFLAYYEEGSLRSRFTFENNVAVGSCEFHFRWNDEQFDMYGTFKDGEYFDGQFLSQVQIESPPHTRSLPHMQYWILTYNEGELIHKKLIVDTVENPIISD